MSKSEPGSGGLAGILGSSAAVGNDVIEWVASAVLFADVTLIFGSIIARDVFRHSVFAADELSAVLVITLTFLGGATAYFRSEHVGVTAVVERWPKAWRPTIDGVGLLCAGLFAAVLAWQALNIARVDPFRLAVSGLSHALIYLPIVLGAASIVAVTTLRFLARAWIHQAIAVVLVAAVVAVGWFGYDTLSGLVQSAPIAYAVALFVLLVVLGLPIAFDLGIAALVLLLMNPTLSLSTIPIQLTAGVGSFVLLALPFFIFAGYILASAGIARRLVRLIEATAGRFRGGAGVSAIIAMYFFSGLSGSKAADIAAVSPVMTPAMESRGHDRNEAVGVFAASAVMGEVVPPSIAILVMAAVTGVSTSALFVAGLLPAATVGLVLIITVIVLARVRGAKRAIPPTWRELARDARGSLIPLLIPLIIFGGIIGGIATPTEASAIAVVAGLIMAVGLYRMKVAEVVRILRSAARLAGMLLFLLACANILAWDLTVYGITGAVKTFAEQFHGDPFIFILVTIGLMLGIGTALEGLPALVILSPILLPAAVSLGIDPLQYCIVVVFATGFAAFLPPLGVGFYTTCAVVGARPEHVIKQTFLYMGATAIGVLVVAFVPAITVWLPAQFAIR